MATGLDGMQHLLNIGCLRLRGGQKVEYRAVMPDIHSVGQKM